MKTVAISILLGVTCLPIGLQQLDNNTFPIAFIATGVLLFVSGYIYKLNNSSHD